MSSLRPAVAVAALTTVLLGAAVPPAPADARTPNAAAKSAKVELRAKKRAARLARTCRRKPSSKACKVVARSALLDRTAPSVTFKAPAAGSTVSGTLSGDGCVATATDRSGIEEVEFTLDGKYLNRERLAAFNCGVNNGSEPVLDTKTLANGAHTLRAKATDKRGNVSTKSVSFTVANTTTTAPAPAPAPEPAPAPAPTEPAPTSGTAFLADEFDNGFGAWNHVQRMATDRIQTVPAPAGRTGNAARFEVRGGDLLSGAARAELAYWDKKAVEGDELVFNWSTRFAADYPSSPHWQDVVQWKNDGTGSPPLQIALWGDKLKLDAGPQHNYKTIWETPLVRGQWLDFTARIKFSSNASIGWVELWYRGQLVVPRTPTQTLFPGLANYFKVGLYRDSAITGTGVVHHDGVRISRP